MDAPNWAICLRSLVGPAPVGREGGTRKSLGSTSRKSGGMAGSVPGAATCKNLFAPPPPAASAARACKVPSSLTRLVASQLRFSDDSLQPQRQRSAAAGHWRLCGARAFTGGRLERNVRLCHTLNDQSLTAVRAYPFATRTNGCRHRGNTTRRSVPVHGCGLR